MWKSLILMSISLQPCLSFLCPNGTMQLGNEHRCLFIETSAQYYLWALKTCDDLQGNLAKISNSFESSLVYGYIINVMNGMSPYIGVEKTSNGTWQYSDETSLVYSNWAMNEPNTVAGNNCAIMDGDSMKWKAVDCVTPRPYICTIEAEQVMQCPDGWVYSDSLDYCYYLQNFTYIDGVSWLDYNWTSAEKNCYLMNGHLVSIHTPAEDDFVSRLVNQDLSGFAHGAPPEKKCQYSNAWIGLYANGQVGNGTWSDGTPVNYTNTPSTNPYEVPWMIMNKDCENQSPAWKYYSLETNTARFVCKQSSKSRTIRKALEAIKIKQLSSKNFA